MSTKHEYLSFPNSFFQVLFDFQVVLFFQSNIGSSLEYLVLRAKKWKGKLMKRYRYFLWMDISKASLKTTKFHKADYCFSKIPGAFYSFSLFDSDVIHRDFGWQKENAELL